ncbi:hypothetical protein D7S89_15750 [Trinickia fusca]|uniref:Uncharacterized protein n=1 Tax=Trinickia fusca TaxID=2419777 RepID=A0A494XHI8_9BURK|nr:hypothetical protein D7S89_15750 [Trinickia fusca]
MRRVAWSLGFGVIGCVSLIAWAAIDTHLCGVFAKLCTPRTGECGGGLDACPATAHTVADLVIYLLLPPIVFCVLGYAISKGRPKASTVARYILIAVSLHWFLAFLGVRLFHV